jgi:hypothetical protein
MLRRVTFIGDSSVLIVLSSPNWISYWKCKFIRWQFDFNQGTLTKGKTTFVLLVINLAHSFGLAAFFQTTLNWRPTVLSLPVLLVFLGLSFINVSSRSIYFNKRCLTRQKLVQFQLSHLRWNLNNVTVVINNLLICGRTYFLTKKKQVFSENYFELISNGFKTFRFRMRLKTWRVC